MPAAGRSCTPFLSAVPIAAHEVHASWGLCKSGDMNHQKLEPLPPELLERARSARRVLVLTGAGMSAESGVPTFRDESAGLWARYSPEAMATEEGCL